MRLCCYFQFKCKTTRLLLPSILYLGLFPFTLKILVPNDISIITYSLYPQSQVTLTLITENNVTYFWQLVLFSLYRLIVLLIPQSHSLWGYVNNLVYDSIRFCISFPFLFHFVLWLCTTFIWFRSQNSP